MISKLRRLTDSKKIRFAIIGGLNTALDFIVFIILVVVGVAPFVSNLASTSVGMAFSFTLNRKFTFRVSNENRRSQVVKFLVVTLAGLWLIQPIIIYAVTYGLSVSFSIDSSQALPNAIGKILATGVSLVWNYYLYSRFVFTSKNQ